MPFRFAFLLFDRCNTTGAGQFTLGVATLGHSMRGYHDCCGLCNYGNVAVVFVSTPDGWVRLPFRICISVICGHGVGMLTAWSLRVLFSSFWISQGLVVRCGNIVVAMRSLPLSLLLRGQCSMGFVTAIFQPSDRNSAIGSLR